MSELEVAGNIYQIGKMNALVQLHVVRRLGPALIVVGISMEALRQGMKVEMEDLIASAGPVMEMISRMSDEDFNYVLFACLDVVRRKQEDKWAAVVVPGQQKLMFADMDFAALVRLAVEVLRENLGNFLTELSGEVSSSKP